MTRFVSMTLVAAALLGLAVAPSASAQALADTLATGAFAALSPGNQKIAQALYDAQQTPTAGTTTTVKVYSLDEIAALKQGGQGWGEIFRTMQAHDQLVGARNLGQIVSGHYQPPAPTTPTTPAGVTASRPSGASTGAFDRLSPGNQKIARALYDAQARPATGTTSTTKVYSLDEIAALKQSGRGWGGVYRTMKAEGQLHGTRNLGHVVSGKTFSSSGVTTITTASGRTDVIATTSGRAVGSPAMHGSAGKHVGAGGSSPGSRGGAAAVASQPAGGHGRVTHGKPVTAPAQSHGRGHVK